MTTTSSHRAEELLEQLRVAPGSALRLGDRDPAWTLGPEFDALSPHELKQQADQTLRDGIEDLKRCQELLWASDTYSLLIVFQALDAAGKDSAIEHVMSGVNPQGVQVVSFKQPSSEELDHDFLWRAAKALPERGRIGIFNRSHYEEVVALRVHPEWLAAQKLPRATRDKPDERFWQERYEDINAFEQHLYRSGTRIVKFFLHLSRAEQKRRFMARLDNPDKHWKFNAGDVDERERWDDYTSAFEDAISATSTTWAPWFVLPADNKRVTQALVARILVRTIEELDLHYPNVSAAQRAKNEAARKRLEAESD